MFNTNQFYDSIKIFTHATRDVRKAHWENTLSPFYAMLCHTLTHLHGALSHTHPFPRCFDILAGVVEVGFLAFDALGASAAAGLCVARSGRRRHHQVVAQLAERVAARARLQRHRQLKHSAGSASKH